MLHPSAMHVRSAMRTTSARKPASTACHRPPTLTAPRRERAPCSSARLMGTQVRSSSSVCPGDEDVEGSLASGSTSPR